MKRIFQMIGIFVLISFCFIYTEEAITVVKEYDDIMIKIKAEAKDYKSTGENAIINDNTMIPGISRYEIDINKSYVKMKEYGKYKETLIVYKKIEPVTSIKNHKNNYIVSGNSKKQMASILFLVDKTELVEKTISILENNKIEASFFIKENDESLIKIITKKNGIGLYNKYDDWLNKSIKIIGNIELNYCFDDSDQLLEDCYKNDLYTIKTDIIKNSPLVNTKKYLKNGSILTYKLTDEVLNELPLIIKYINSKGIELKKLDILLEE